MSLTFNLKMVLTKPLEENVFCFEENILIQRGTEMMSEFDEKFELTCRSAL